jgi:hypothetical protein
VEQYSAQRRHRQFAHEFFWDQNHGTQEATGGWRHGESGQLERRRLPHSHLPAATVQQLLKLRWSLSRFRDAARDVSRATDENTKQDYASSNPG